MKKIKYKDRKVEYDIAMNILEGNHPLYKSLYSYTLIEFECTQCGITTTKRNANFKQTNYVKLCSRCLSKLTCIEKYGTSNPMQNKDVQQKAIDTCIEKYGSKSPLESKIILDKIKETNIKKYGYENPLSNKDVQQKVKQTNLKKFGTEYALSNKDIRKKIIETNNRLYGCDWGLSNDMIKSKSRETCKQRYGYEYASQSDIVKQKSKETSLSRYGVEHPFQLDSSKQKFKETCLTKYGEDHPSKCDHVKIKKINTFMKHYGTDHYSHTLESRKNRKNHICYNNEYFDSIPEMEFYKFCLENNIKVIRHPKKLEYSFDNKTHSYYPDFEANGILIEIKGYQFLNSENNKWMNPYNRDDDKKYEAKYDCAVSNNVKIIYVNSKIKTEDILNTLCLY